MGPQGVEPRGSPAQTTRRDAYYSGDPRDREPPREHNMQHGPTGLQTSPITPEHGQYYAGQQGEDPWSTFQPLPPPNYYGMFPSYAPYGPQYGPQGLVSRAYGGFGAPHLRFPGPPLPRDTPPRPPPPPPPQTPAWTKEIRSMRGELEDSLAKAMGVLCSTLDKRQGCHKVWKTWKVMEKWHSLESQGKSGKKENLAKKSWKVRELFS